MLPPLVTRIVPFTGFWLLSIRMKVLEFTLFGSMLSLKVTSSSIFSVATPSVSFAGDVEITLGGVVSGLASETKPHS